MVFRTLALAVSLVCSASCARGIWNTATDPQGRQIRVYEPRPYYLGCHSYPEDYKPRDSTEARLVALAVDRVRTEWPDMTGAVLCSLAKDKHGMVINAGPLGGRADGLLDTSHFYRFRWDGTFEWEHGW
jgi:hypothetical protein